MTTQIDSSKVPTDVIKARLEGKEIEVKEEEKKGESEQPSTALMEGQPSILVKVGRDAATATWNLPKGLLVRVTPFFEAALNRPWLESRTESVDLPEDSPDAFRFFLHWLFTWMVCRPGEYPKMISLEATSSVYLQAWVLGDKLGCPRFQDFALAHLHGTSTRIPVTPGVLESIYDMTPAGSKLRQYMTYVIVGWVRESRFVTAVQDAWINSIEGMEDASLDIVKSLIRNDKQVLGDFLLLSAWKDYVFPTS
ncbi:MAG: hypothetical protein Q9169_002617 [Polycauliona sp. 2 TL-2023]